MPVRNRPRRRPTARWSDAETGGLAAFWGADFGTNDAMFDMSWGEVMLIGGVALIVIGPKDLPRALRTLGQLTTKVRRMAGEFQHQFNEAIREAELEDIKRDVAGVKRTAESFRPSFNPVDTIRNELKNAVEGRLSPTTADPLAGTATGALATATRGPDEPDPRVGAYDVPRPITPLPQVEPAAPTDATISSTDGSAS